MSTLFSKGSRTIVGMIHLGKLPGQRGFSTMSDVIERALADLRELEAVYGAALDGYFPE